MSWNISLEILAGTSGETAELFWRNCTYNLAPMLCEIFQDKRGINSINMLTADEAAKKIYKAVQFMNDNREELEKLNPKNGWGSFEGLRDVLVELMEACFKYDLCTVFVR